MTRLTDPRIFNIETGLPFADSLARGLLDKTAQDPLSLSDYTILLPSRRACRTLRDAFLRLSGGGALLLPRLQPIGDVDAEDFSLLLAASDDADGVLDLPPAISRLERQILLAQLILRKDPTQSFDQAAVLALELGRFLDEVQTEGLSFDDLHRIVPAQFSGHWQQTLEFLKIITGYWPDILQDLGVMDYAARRNALLRLQRRAWEKNPPQKPVLAVADALTCTVPAAVELLALVPGLPQGVLLLPGLDARMDEESWQNLTPDHPQHDLKKLLALLGLPRENVAAWPLAQAKPFNSARVRLLAEALRPAQTTERWRDLTTSDIPSQAMQGFLRIDCATAQEEADTIAYLLRETLETPGRTAALVTPDRRLARRVTLALRRWSIQIDDTGGQPLTEMRVGTWLTLSARMAAEKLAPVALLGFLKHPFMAAGLPPEELRGMIYLLDRLVLRGPRPAPGFLGLRSAIEGLGDGKSADKARLLSWVSLLQERMQPFMSLMQGQQPVAFKDLLRAHLHMAEDLAATQDKTGAARIWMAEAGEAAADFLTDLLKAAAGVPPIAPQNYAALLSHLLKGITVRPRFGAHPRLTILGLMEARLFSADRIILGGLNEGSWPSDAAHDPWMSWPMRQAFGLPSPERTIGLAAHDFVQCAAAADVVLTRAAKIDGTPTVPARWLMRLDAVLAATGLEWDISRARAYKNAVRRMDEPAQVRPVTRPSPTPPASARPKELSVTKIESWMRDPYQIYAQYVLSLRALDPIDADPGAAERGTFIHTALERFIKDYQKTLPTDAVEKLLFYGRQALQELAVPPEVEAFWWPRFVSIADLFIAQERQWREGASPFKVEVSGRLDLGGFILSGKADRIDRKKEGSYAVIDYKTGMTPRSTDIRAGLSPQLPLEALMLERGAFADIPPGKVGDLLYWKATGSGQKPIEQISIASTAFPVDRLVMEAEEGLRRLIETYRDEKTPYLSQPRAAAVPRFSDYAHLARVREWGISGDEDDTAGEAA